MDNRCSLINGFRNLNSAFRLAKQTDKVLNMSASQNQQPCSNLSWSYPRSSCRTDWENKRYARQLRLALSLTIRYTRNRNQNGSSSTALKPLVESHIRHIVQMYVSSLNIMGFTKILYKAVTPIILMPYLCNFKLSHFLYGQKNLLYIVFILRQ